MVSDAHEGLKAAIRRVLGATWQRCQVHWMRSALAHVGKGQQAVVAAALRQAFLQADEAAAHQVWRQVADQLRPRWPKLSALMDESEHDVPAYTGFPAQHRAKLHSTNPLERLNKEVKRRADVVGIFPCETSITRLIGAVLLEQNDEWQLQHRYMQVEAMAELAPPAAEPEPAQFHPRPRGRWPPQRHSNLHLLDGRDLITGLNGWTFRGCALAGMVVGWVHKPAALLVDQPYGRGRVVATTFRLLEDAPGVDPTATALLDGLVEQALAGARRAEPEVELTPAA